LKTSCHIVFCDVSLPPSFGLRVGTRHSTLSPFDDGKDC
jgi:hypothetical protein